MFGVVGRLRKGVTAIVDRVGEGKSQGDGGSEAGTGTFGGGVASVLAGDIADEEEAEAGALDAGDGAAGDAVKAFEDALELAGSRPTPVSVMVRAMEV